MPRLLRTAGSLAIVVVAYWAYALVAVPLIEPPAKTGDRGAPASQADREAPGVRITTEIDKLKGLFPPEAWQLKSPKILESQQVKLLMQSYRNLGDGRVKIHPCTMIFTPDGPADDEAQRKRRAVILEAPEGAVLEFDRPFDLRQIKIGRLVGGQLIGRITIRSKGKSPGPEDDLLIVTQNVQLTEKNVLTRHAVDFRYGPHYGRGSQMRIKLLSDEAAGGTANPEGGIAGIELFELRHLERLHLELGELELASGKTPGAVASRPDAAASAFPSVGDGNPLPNGRPGGSPGDVGRKTPAGRPPAAAKSNLPVEVTCKGPFTFDAIRNRAIFKDRVDVLRLNPTGPSDQLNCEELSVFFADRNQPPPAGTSTDKDGPKKRPAGSLSLQPQRIEARGNPVVVHAPSQGAHARGERLEYDLKTGRIVLDGGHEVLLRQSQSETQTREIHARSLEYQPTDTGQLARILAQGPGWLRGQIDQRPGEPLEARWNEQLSVRPHEGNQVISLTGAAGLKFREIGQLDAGEIHFWLLESKPQGPDDPARLRPDRMLARGDVRIRSQQLDGAVEQLEVWFEPSPRAEGGKPKAESGERKAEAPPSDRRYGDLPPATVEAPATGQPASPPATRQQHFQISGRLLRARMLLPEDGQGGLSELMVEDGVQFVETQTKQPDERPLLVRGDRLHVVDADQPYAAVTVSGQPAHFQGRGLALTGPNINLNRGTNRLWVDAAGQMDLVMTRDLEGRLLASPATLQVRWQDSMMFDGRTAKFEEAVTVSSPNRNLQTETLEVQFKRPIIFSDDKIRQDPDVERLLCRGGVFMENVSFDEERPDQQTSCERMQVTDLAISLDGGALTAGGPGWLTSVTRGSKDPLGGFTDGNRALSGPRNAAPAADAADTDHDGRLRGLHVRFQGSISGNVHKGRREMTFHDRVQAAYAPVDSWAAVLDVNDPEALGPDGVLMHCDRLSIHEMTTPDGKSRTVELEAQGNAEVERSTFNARAARITYAQAKDLLILEGDGRSDAELFHQQQVGGPTPKFAARKILYWPKTGRVNSEGARSLNLDRLPAGNPGQR